MIHDDGPRLAKSSRRVVRGVLLVFAAVAAAAGVWVVAAVPPGNDTFYPRCQFHSLTGLHCPGCGTTRAIHALLNGRVLQALAYNALALVIVPVVAWSLFGSLRTYQHGRPVRESRRTTLAFMPWLILAALFLYSFLRNIPAYPFTLLAPHEL